MKTAEELFNELKDESFVFYGSGAEGYYSGAEAFSGLIFTKKEFDEIKRDFPEQLPDTEDYFAELDGKHSETEGSEFQKYFDALEDYYIWYIDNNVELDSPYYQALEGMDEKFLKTSIYLHSLQDWRVKSVFDYIKENYEVKQVVTLVKKENN